MKFLFTIVLKIGFLIVVNRMVFKFWFCFWNYLRNCLMELIKENYFDKTNIKDYLKLLALENERNFYCKTDTFGQSLKFQTTIQREWIYLWNFQGIFLSLKQTNGKKICEPCWICTETLIYCVGIQQTLTSWRKGACLALVGHPSSDGVTKKTPYGVDALLHQPASHHTFSYWTG